MSRPILLPFIAVVAVHATSSQCQTTGSLPDSPPGRRLAELIAVLNSGSYDSVRTYTEGALEQRSIRVRAAGEVRDACTCTFRLCKERS